MSARLKKLCLDAVLPKPVAARHGEYSMILSADDEPMRPSRMLMDIAVSAIVRARDVWLEGFETRAPGSAEVANLWPGEQHRLLAALVEVRQPARIVEIGTGPGISTLAMASRMPRDGRLITFDIVPWMQIPETVFRDDDFADGRLLQHLDDVTRPEGWALHRRAFEEADLVFVDAAKDGRMEARIVELLRTCAFRTPPLLVFDDIRVWNMLAVWRALPWPKLDLTSFGHWTGTGLAEWRLVGA